MRRNESKKRPSGAPPVGCSALLGGSAAQANLTMHLDLEKLGAAIEASSPEALAAMLADPRQMLKLKDGELILNPRFAAADPPLE